MPECPNCHHEVSEEALYCGNCAALLNEEVDNFIGKCIDGKYYIQERIASGGMGDVYLARQKGVGQEVAIKKLKREYYQDRVIVERFINEARLYGRVTHPNAVKLHDLLNVNGQICIIMEYVHGKTLTRYVESGYIFSTRQIIDIALQIADALATMHQAGIIHRDLKTENIMLMETVSGRFSVKILDFGIAKIKDGRSNSMTQEGVIVGTPEFMSPEQCFGAKVDHRADIYSFGILLYVMICGRLPYEATNALAMLQKQVSEPLPELVRMDGSKVQPGLEGIVRKCAMKEADARYQSMVDVITDLTCLQEGRETSLELAAVRREPSEKEERAKKCESERESSAKETALKDSGSSPGSEEKTSGSRKRAKKSGEKSGSRKRAKKSSENTLENSGDGPSLSGDMLAVSGEMPAVSGDGPVLSLDISEDGPSLSLEISEDELTASGERPALSLDTPEQSASMLKGGSGDGPSLSGELKMGSASNSKAADDSGSAKKASKAHDVEELGAIDIGNDEFKLGPDDDEPVSDDRDISLGSGLDISATSEGGGPDAGRESGYNLGVLEISEGGYKTDVVRTYSESGKSKLWILFVIVVLIGIGFVLYVYGTDNVREFIDSHLPKTIQITSDDVKSDTGGKAGTAQETDGDTSDTSNPDGGGRAEAEQPPKREPVPPCAVNSHAVILRGVNRAMMAEAETKLNVDAKLDEVEKLLKAVKDPAGPEAERASQLNDMYLKFKSVEDRAVNFKRRERCGEIRNLVSELPDNAVGMQKKLNDMAVACQRTLEAAPTTL